MSLPNIAISMITYNRKTCFNRVMDSLYENIIYPKDKVTLVISDDCSDEDYISDWQGFYNDTILIKRKERGGMPVNWNGAIREASKHGDFLYCIQDDWLHTEKVDLRLAVRLLQSNPEYGFFRFHKVAGHVGLNMTVKQWNTAESGVNGFVDSYHDYDPSLATTLELLPPFDGSNTYSPYSGGVHLRHVDFTSWYGEYTEGLRFSLAEMDYFERVNDCLRTNLNVCPRFVTTPHYLQARFKDISPASYRDTAVEAETLK